MVVILYGVKAAEISVAFFFLAKIVDMNYHKFLLGLVLLVFVQSYAQDGEIRYRSTFYDMPDVDKNQEMKMKIAREINDMKYLLRYTNEESYFETLPRVPHDEFMAKFAIGAAHSLFPWHQNPKTMKAFYNKKIKDSMYIVINDERMGGWTLHNETKDIDGYTCYKATKHHVQYYTENEFTIEAWYTPEIPVPYGPIGSGGLPGLILQLERSHVIFIADKITLNPKNGIKAMPEIENGRKIDETERRVLMRRARKVTEN